MVFASPVFLFIFLPAFLLVYSLLPAKARPYWLLAGSLGFYFWGEPVYVLLMVAAILVTWCAGFLTERMKDQGNGIGTYYYNTMFLKNQNASYL